MIYIADEKKELDRLTKLAELDLDYSKDYTELDDLSKLAAHIAGTSVSLINLVGANTQWSISDHGMDVRQMPREDSICDHTIYKTDYLEVTDLDKSNDFKDKSYVTGDPNLRYYFGIPLKTKEGISVGAICVMDQNNHSFPPEKIEMFKIIATEVMRRLEHHKMVKDLKEELEEAILLTRKVSHDIRGPISGIIGMTDLLKEEPDEQDMSDVIDLINKGSKSILDLADEILSTPKIDNENPDFKREAINFSTLKEKLIDLYKPQAQLKDIKFKVMIEMKNRELLFPKNKLMQIFGNMISNAIKFTNNNGNVFVNLQFSELRDIRAKLKFSVKDDGVGMTEQQVEQMLNHQAQSTVGTNNERGFGFGFQLSKHLISTLNGTIDIKSELNKGTEILVEIPVAMLRKMS